MLGDGCVVIDFGGLECQCFGVGGRVGIEGGDISGVVWRPGGGSWGEGGVGGVGMVVR